MLDPLDGGVLPVLDLNPIRRAAGAVAAVAALGGHALKPELASRAEQVRPDLTYYAIPSIEII